jgi:hypothetical protein
MPDTEEFCTRDPHLDGAKVFRKCKSDTPIGVDEENLKVQFFLDS